MFRGRLPFQLLPLLHLLVVNQRHLCDHGHHFDDTYIIFVFTIVIEKNVVAGVMTVKSAKRKLLQRQVVVNPRHICGLDHHCDDKYDHDKVNSLWWVS